MARIARLWAGGFAPGGRPINVSLTDSGLGKGQRPASSASGWTNRSRLSVGIGGESTETNRCCSIVDRRFLGVASGISGLFAKAVAVVGLKIVSAEEWFSGRRLYGISNEVDRENGMAEPPPLSPWEFRRRHSAATRVDQMVARFIREPRKGGRRGKLRSRPALSGSKSLRRVAFAGPVCMKDGATTRIWRDMLQGSGPWRSLTIGNRSPVSCKTRRIQKRHKLFAHVPSRGFYPTGVGSGRQFGITSRDGFWFVRAEFRSGREKIRPLWLPPGGDRLVRKRPEDAQAILCHRQPFPL